MNQQDASDRELLELAAKAAGMQGWKFTGTSMAKMIDPSRPEETGSIGRDWSPLTDDGDALRLANKLGLIVSVSRPEVKNRSTNARRENEGFGVTIMHYQDADRATRYAIVRAAAEIGRQA